MSIPWKKYSWLFIVLILGLLLAFIPTLVSASLLIDSLLPDPVAPEPYPNSNIYPAVVYLATQNDLQILYRQNIDIDSLKSVDGNDNSSRSSFQPSIAIVYIDPTQSNALHQAGLGPVPIPNEGYRSFLAYGPGSGAPNAWPTFDEYVARMQGLADTYPNIISLVQIGKSVENRGLYCLEITSDPGVDKYKPEFKYTANHHGDETSGIEMTMRLAELLANSYGTDPVITDMVDKMEIWLCPIYNPDGYVAGDRYNANGYDLNRNYPDRFNGPPAHPQPETQAFMDFESAHRFVMGANYHGGALVLNYPWDAVAAPGDPIIPAYAPDDDLFYGFGIGYTSRNPDLWNGGFPQGITRGWEWYQIWGGMQDWDYYYHGEHHVTIEISNSKSPPFSQMDTYWDHNRDSMLWWIQRVWTGLGGQVLDARNSAPMDATITLVGRAVPNIILTDPQVGDYHRVISAGSYTLETTASGYITQTANIIVYSDTVSTQDFYLCPGAPWVVSGTITDAVSGLPLQATIEFVGSHQAASSNPANGQYSIEICPSTYSMHVWAPWHYDQERIVTIDHDQTQNFSLDPTPNLSPSTKRASATQVLPQELVQYQLYVENLGTTASVTVTDTLPISLTWTGDLTATRGTPTFDAGQILWQDEVAAGQPVTITYAVSVNQCLSAGTTILNIVEFDDGVNGIITGKVELNVSNAAPSFPELPFPMDGSINQSISITLTWASNTDLNCDVTYDIAFGTVSPPPMIDYNLPVPLYNPGSLNIGTTYYWEVVAKDGEYLNNGPVWSFRTAGELQKIYLPLTIR